MGANLESERENYKEIKIFEVLKSNDSNYLSDAEKYLKYEISKNEHIFQEAEKNSKSQFLLHSRKIDLFLIEKAQFLLNPIEEAYSPFFITFLTNTFTKWRTQWLRELNFKLRVLSEQTQNELKAYFLFHLDYILLPKFMKKLKHKIQTFLITTHFGIDLSTLSTSQLETLHKTTEFNYLVKECTQWFLYLELLFDLISRLEHYNIFSPTSDDYLNLKLKYTLPTTDSIKSEANQAEDNGILKHFPSLNHVLKELPEIISSYSSMVSTKITNSLWSLLQIASKVLVKLGSKGLNTAQSLAYSFPFFLLSLSGVGLTLPCAAIGCTAALSANVINFKLVTNLILGAIFIKLATSSLSQGSSNQNKLRSDAQKDLLLLSTCFRKANCELKEKLSIINKLLIQNMKSSEYEKEKTKLNLRIIDAIENLISQEKVEGVCFATNPSEIPLSIESKRTNNPFATDESEESLDKPLISDNYEENKSEELVGERNHCGHYLWKCLDVCDVDEEWVLVNQFRIKEEGVVLKEEEGFVGVALRVQQQKDDEKKTQLQFQESHAQSIQQYDLKVSQLFQINK